MRLPGPVRVHLLTTGLLTVGLVLYGLVVRFLPAAPAPVQLPWPVLAAGFAATTVFAVHLEFRRHAHSFALSELPLVTGLYLLSPAELVLAEPAMTLAAESKAAREDAVAKLHAVTPRLPPFDAPQDIRPVVVRPRGRGNSDRSSGG